MKYPLPDAVRKSAELLADNYGETLVGWVISQPVPEDPTQGLPAGWYVITNKGFYEVSNEGICYRSALLHPF